MIIVHRKKGGSDMIDPGGGGHIHFFKDPGGGVGNISISRDPGGGEGHSIMKDPGTAGGF